MELPSGGHWTNAIVSPYVDSAASVDAVMERRGRERTLNDGGGNMSNLVDVLLLEQFSLRHESGVDKVVRFYDDRQRNVAIDEGDAPILANASANPGASALAIYFGSTCNRLVAISHRDYGRGQRRTKRRSDETTERRTHPGLARLRPLLLVGTGESLAVQDVSSRRTTIRNDELISLDHISSLGDGNRRDVLLPVVGEQEGRSRTYSLRQYAANEGVDDDVEGNGTTSRSATTEGSESRRRRSASPGKEGRRRRFASTNLGRKSRAPPCAT